MIDMIFDILKLVRPEYKVVFMSALPVIELRGAIPLGLAMGLTTIKTFSLAYIGSILPLPILFFCLRPLFNRLKSVAVFANAIEKLSIRTLRKSQFVKKYDWFGLLVFVAIPVPGTGVWSGVLIANLLDIRFKNAMLAILVGNLIAGVIVTLISTGFISLFS
ncbi:MAG: small multi-drug export protein [Acidaminobacteraceae bacterium]